MPVPPPYEHKPSTVKYLLIALIVLITLALAVSTYRYLSKDGLAGTLLAVKQENLTLHRHNSQLEAQRKELIEDSLNQQQQMALQQATATELQSQLTELQNNIITLRQELDFYQNITQGQTTSKLHVRELRITADKLKEGYQYQLVLSQGKKISQPLKGKIKLTLNGQIAGKDATQHIGEHALKLKHVQILQGQIQLDADFIPSSVNISITDKNKKRLNTTLDWHETSSLTQTER